MFEIFIICFVNFTFFMDIIRSDVRKYNTKFQVDRMASLSYPARVPASIMLSDGSVVSGILLPHSPVGHESNNM